MKKLKDYLREILHTYELGTFVSEGDSKILKVVVSRHPRAIEKMGTGIVGFTVEDGTYGNRCFYVHRSDGTKTDFSFLKCFGKKNDDFSSACRRAVEPSTIQFRTTLPDAFDCPILDIPITSTTCHIDHAPPNTFRQIVKAFVLENSIDTSSVEYDRSGIGVSFKDQEMRDSFIKFHDDRAQLRGISKEANLSLPKL